MIANAGSTWDMIAYDALGDEFSMNDVMKENRRDYADVVIFEGGEEITISETSYQKAAIVEPPWVKQ